MAFYVQVHAPSFDVTKFPDGVECGCRDELLGVEASHSVGQAYNFLANTFDEFRGGDNQYAEVIDCGNGAKVAEAFEAKIHELEAIT